VYLEYVTVHRLPPGPWTVAADNSKFFSHSPPDIVAASCIHRWELFTGQLPPNLPLHKMKVDPLNTPIRLAQK